MFDLSRLDREPEPATDHPPISAWSGGQRQRLAIARALYRQPSVLVLDEGTSALDQTTESDLMNALVPLRGSRTIVAVAHRLTTVESCDRVVLVDAGRIVDVAPFGELTAKHRRLIAWNHESRTS